MLSGLKEAQLSPAGGLQPHSTAIGSEAANEQWENEYRRNEAWQQKDYRQIWLTHQRLFWVMLLSCTALAALFSWSLSPVYQAKATLELQGPGPAVLAQSAPDPSAVAMIPTYDAYLATQIGILQSDTLIGKTADRLQLTRRLSRLQGGRLDGVRQFLGFAAKPKTLTRAQALAIARQNLVVRQARLNSMIEILYSAEDPKLAADFANTLADEYARQSLETRGEYAQQLEGSLTRQLNTLRSRLESSEQALQNYDERNNLLPVDGQDSIALAKLRQLQDRLTQAQAERIQKQTQLEGAMSGPAEAIPQLQDNSGFADLQVKLGDLRRQLAEYEQLYTPDYSKVRTVKAQMREAEAALARQVAATRGRLGEEFHTAAANEKMLQAEYNRQSAMVSGENSRMIRYNTLKHEVDTNRALYESVLQKVKESGVAAALPSTSIRVVDQAEIPVRPYKPIHLLNVGAGLLSGVLLGLGAVALRFRKQLRIRSLPRSLSAIELGVIPSSDLFVEITAPASELSPARRTAPELFRTTGSRSKLPPPQRELLCWLMPNSAYTDAMRGVMTSLLLTKNMQHRKKMMLVTSPNPGEGKTTLASNLAFLLSQTGRRTLLIDADVRRPRLHKIFDLPRAPGLTDWSKAQAPYKAQLRSLVRPTGLANLSVLPGGEATPEDYHFFHGASFAAALASLREEYDTIILDAPPVLGVPETRVLAALSDGVVLVLRSGSTTVEDAVTTQAQILQDGGHLLGTVLSDAPVTMTPYHALRDSYAASA